MLLHVFGAVMPVVFIRNTGDDFTGLTASGHAGGNLASGHGFGQSVRHALISQIISLQGLYRITAAPLALPQ